MKRKPSDINLLLAVDKPVGCTSHDVVSRVRRALDERRVGHAGTLDPLASGVMVVGVGQATRLLGRITLDRKAYLARIAFGSETTTDDAEGEVARTVEPSSELFDEVFAKRILSGFLGLQQQVPPAFSAISVNGVRSYKRARAGEEVVLEARPVEVYSASLIAIDQVDGCPVWTVSFEVSKGTYIRSLARDIGRAAGGAAHVSDLRRTASGSISSGMCAPLDDLDRSMARDAALDPLRVLGLGAFDLTDRTLEDVRCGRPIDLDCLVAHGGEAQLQEGSAAALVHAGELRAIAVLKQGRLFMDDVFPQGIGGVK